MEKLDNIKVLVVDDNKFALSQLSKIIESTGFIVEEADGSKNALDIIRQNKPDIVVTDYNMPEINGLKLAEEILKDHPEMPVVLISALDNKEMLAEAIQLGVKQYIAKPINVSQLINTIKALAENINLQRDVDVKLGQLETLYNASYDIIFVIDDSSQIIFANQQFYSSINSELAGEKNFYKILTDCNCGHLTGFFADLISKSGSDYIENFECFGNRNYKASVGQWLNGSNIQYVIIMHDVTDEMEKKKHEQLFMNVFNNSIEGILITDKDNAIVTCNKAFEYITGYSIDDVKGQNPSILKSGRHDNSFFSDMWEDINDCGYWSGKIYNRRKDGGIYYEFLSIFSICNEKGEVTNYAALFSDLNHKQDATQISRMAYYDMLTNLPNRFYFNEHLRKAISRSYRQNTALAVIYFDLDGFKKINDLHGHPVGDQLLCEVAERLVRNVREMDIIARTGGDEFAVVISDIADPSELEYACKSVADKIITAFKEPFDCLGKKVLSSASMGISSFPRDADNVNDLLKYADTAMYESKKRKKGIYSFYNNEVNNLLNRELFIEELLKNCKMNDEFELHLQPQVSLATGQIEGAEALLRWTNAKEGFISPAEFVPIAENCGIILDIDKFVIKKAGELKSKLDYEGFEYPISINLSAKSLETEEQVNQIIEKLDKHIPGGDVIIEITESSLVTNMSNLILLTQYAREHDIKISIDDFGTGYSSLGYLKDINANSLKIDKVFIDEIENDSNLKTIIEAIIKMAQTMGMKTVAEGVENKNQEEILRSLGCDAYQGYLFSKPLAYPDFKKFFNS